MRLSPFEYVEPRTLKAASRALADDPGGTVLLAGGTDLVVNLKHRLFAPKRVVNLKAVPGLTHLTPARAGLRIGALATLEDLASSALVRERYPVLADAARQAGSYAHQVMGTVGGNLCQGNRCRYYNQTLSWRQARTPCYKAGGEMCWVVQKPEECHATYCGDLAPALIALGARVAIVGPAARRTVPLEGLYTNDGNAPLALAPGEILEQVVVPPPAGRALYLKVRLRDSIEFPIISLAAAIRRGRGGVVRHARIVFSGVEPGPVRASGAEQALVGSQLTDAVLDEVTGRVAREITPLRTSVTTPAYRRRLSGVLLRQALETVRDGAS